MLGVAFPGLPVVPVSRPESSVSRIGIPVSRLVTMFGAAGNTGWPAGTLATDKQKRTAVRKFLPQRCACAYGYL